MQSVCHEQVLKSIENGHHLYFNSDQYNITLSDHFFCTVEVPKHVKDEEELFEGDIKLTPEQKAILQSDDATIENWRIAAQKWKRDGIPYVLDSSLCMLLIK